jgi:hypothetical protein
VFVKNRAGKPLCEAVQTGACAETVGHNLCPTDRNCVHQCNKCLAIKHNGSQCKVHGAPSKPSGGKGKGKGKGKW